VSGETFYVSGCVGGVYGRVQELRQLPMTVNGSFRINDISRYLGAKVWAQKLLKSKNFQYTQLKAP